LPSPYILYNPLHDRKTARARSSERLRSSTLPDEILHETDQSIPKSFDALVTRWEIN